MNQAPLLYFCVSAFAISQILLSIIKLYHQKQVTLPQHLFCAFLVCIGVYLSQEIVLPSENLLLHLIWQHLPTLIPGLFLLCCISIFLDDDRFQPSPIYTLPLALTLLPPLIFELFQDQATHPALAFILVTLPQGLEFLLVATALWIVLSSWKQDLVAERRTLRLVVMGFCGIIIFLVISAQQLTNLSEFEVDLIHYPLAALFLLFMNVFLFQIDSKVFFLSRPEQGDTEKNEVDLKSRPGTEVNSSQLERLLTTIQTDKAFTNPELTITELAYTLKLPEYKLRQLINQGLGFRNFNNFLNHYRCKEAALLLKQSNDNVTEIATQVGFNSLSAFNRSFKAELNQSPREYRKSHQ